MVYIDRFKSTDDLIPHMDGFVPQIADHSLKSRYIGLLAIAGVTVYELAIKDIIYEFSDKKHTALGAAARSKFSNLNGKIKLSDLRNTHIKFFGEKYKKRFDKNFEAHQLDYFRTHRKDITSSYSNLILWRHGFAHKADMPATYEEVKDAYHHGKEVIHCLNKSMVR